MANGKKIQKYKNVETPWPQITWGKVVGGPLWDGEKNEKNEGSIAGQLRRFRPPITPHVHAYDMQLREVRACMVITHSRIWINRVRLSILLVVS